MVFVTGNVSNVLLEKQGSEDGWDVWMFVWWCLRMCPWALGLGINLIDRNNCYFDPRDLRLKIFVVVCNHIMLILNFERRCSNSAGLRFNGESLHCSSSLWFLLKIRSVRMLDTIKCMGHCFGCSMLPGTPWKLASSVLCCHRYCCAADLGVTFVVAQA